MSKHTFLVTFSAFSQRAVGDVYVPVTEFSGQNTDQCALFWIGFIDITIGVS